MIRRRGTNLLSFFVGFGAPLFTAQYLQLVLGLSPLEAGLWSLPSSAGFILGSMATPLLVRRAAPVAVMAAGLGGTGERYSPEVALLFGGWAVATLAVGAITLHRRYP